MTSSPDARVSPAPRIGDPDITSLFRRTLVVVAVAQAFGGAGTAAGITVGALLAQDMLGTDTWAGIPVALFTAGSAASAFLVGRLSGRYGRRWGLTVGFVAGGIGALAVAAAAVVGSVPLLFAALLVYGAGTATNLQTRYAGTDLAPPDRRARAVSVALVATTLGAVAGPNLVEVTGAFAVGIGLPRLAGPFLLSALAYALAGTTLFVWLRPDPSLVARRLVGEAEESSSADDESGRVPSGVLVGASVMILTQVAMVALMTMTPVHMAHHGHGLGAVGIVIAIHVAAMYLPSPLTGYLVDRVGRMPVSLAAGVTLLGAGVLAAVAPPDSTVLLVVSLALLGLGWNFGLVAGSAIVVDATSPQTRARTQGAVDVFIALGGATGGALSGVVMSGAGFGVLALSGGVLSLVLVPVLVVDRMRRSAHA